MQTAIVILIVLACAAYAARELMRTLRVGDGKAGACCSKGCGGDQTAATTPTASREQFIPADSLRRRK